MDALKRAPVLEAARSQGGARVYERLLDRLGGSGLDLLGSILSPLLWRNTLTSVASILKLPQCHSIVVRVNLAHGEQTLLRELKAGYGAGIVVQARALIAQAAVTASGVPGNAAHAALMRRASDVTAAAAAGGGGAGRAGVFAASKLSLSAVLDLAREATWDLRQICCHVSVGGS